MKSVSIKKYLAEGLLIVFSVLFALFINNMAESWQTKKRRNIALESITKELQRNKGVLGHWQIKHSEMFNRIEAIVAGKEDSLLNALSDNDFLDISLITGGQSLVDAFITNTAWETAKTTGILEEFDFETTQKLTLVYAMQDILMDQTLRNILNFYFNLDTHKRANRKAVLIQFQLRFQEMIGQENMLEQLYQEALVALSTAPN